MKKRRSAGITVVSFLFVLIGLLGFLSSLQALITDRETYDINKTFRERMERYPLDVKAIFIDSPYVNDLLNAFQEIVKSKDYAISSAINAVMCFIVALLGIGIWKLKESARKAAMIFFVIAIPVYVWAGMIFLSVAKKALEANTLYILTKTAVFSYFHVLNFISLSINAAAIIYYFNRPRVKEQFR